MNVVIIEDEWMLADELEHYIGLINKELKVVKLLYSVKESVEYFKANNNYQLIFSDIQLGDGLSFDIFKEVSIKTPVIFCTAYNQYALAAFKNNGIDYLLKPFNKSAVAEALVKYDLLKNTVNKTSAQIQNVAEQLAPAKPPKPVQSSLLVNHRDKIIPLKIEELALFYIKNGTVSAIDFTNQLFTINQTLDELEQLVGNNFYRADRQHLISRKAIKDVSQYFLRKLLLNLNIQYSGAITIRKEKTPEFLAWLAL
jgi:two-component system response regulator LytT